MLHQEAIQKHCLNHDSHDYRIFMISNNRTNSLNPVNCGPVLLPRAADHELQTTQECKKPPTVFTS
jgi:hypothetical protein